YETKGDVYRATKNDAKALEAYSTACDMTATASLLKKIAETTFANPKPDCKALVDRLSARTGDLNAIPVLREFLARALHCDKRRDEALEQLRLAYKQRAQFIQDGRMKPIDISTWFQSVTFVFPSGTPGVLDAPAAEQFVLDLCKNAPSVREMQGMARLWL